MGNDKQEQRNRKFNPPGKTKGNANTGNTTEFEFIDTYLDKADEEWLEANSDVADEAVLSLIGEVEVGFKLSVSFDQRSSQYLASLTDNSAGSPNTGKIRTARASTAFDALYALYYKLRYKSPDGVWEKGASTRKWG